MNNENVKVFISYSHDDDGHKDWVYKFACDLVKNGVDAILDQWNLSLGANLPRFMEQGLTKSDRVLVVCTNKYNEKSNKGHGGAGYESTILTGELLYSQDTTKFVPVVRNVDGIVKTPTCLSGRAYIDFSDDNDYAQSFNHLLHELHGIPLRPKPKLGKNPLQKTAETTPTLNGKDSTVFFDKRFSAAFPGVRGIQWFKSKEAIQRLSILLADPLRFQDGSPLWWWRNGDLPIETFKEVSDSTVLIDEEELIIEEVGAVNSGAYYQKFVYVKTNPSTPSGVYNYDYITEQKKRQGYAHEEFAVFEGKAITRSEYDDNAAVIDEQPIQLNGAAELRIRYLTPYNFIIAPQNSPINNQKFDQFRDQLLNEILLETKNLEDFTKELLKLPKRPTYRI